MKLHRTSAYSLARKMRSKQVVCFGAGMRLENMCRDFADCHFEEKIDYIVDNNSKLWGTVKELAGRKIKICSPEELCASVQKNTMIVISTDRVTEVLEQLGGYKQLQSVKCYRYPSVRYMAAKLWDGLFGLLPLQDTIMLQGEGDSCENALALSEYLIDNNYLKKYKLVWLCDHPERFEQSKRVKYINRRAEFEEKNIFNIWRDRYYRQTSRYLMYENKYIQKTREEQISIYLKHGTFMLKNVKGKIVLPPNVNYAICTSENYADLAADQESVDKEKLLICGSPRLDFLYKEKDVLHRLGIYEKDKRYVIWLPTMRQATFSNDRIDTSADYPFGIPVLQSEEELRLLDGRLEELDLKLLVKPHPRQDLSVFKLDAYRNIIFVPQSVLDEHMLTVHSLMRETAALISDYSSVAFDYMLLDRPIAYTVDDMEDYTIGFSVENPLDYMPGEKLRSIDDMLTFLEHVAGDEDVSVEARRSIRDYIHKYQDARNCERFVEFMKL